MVTRLLVTLDGGMGPGTGQHGCRLWLPPRPLGPGWQRDRQPSPESCSSVWGRGLGPPWPGVGRALGQPSCPVLGPAGPEAALPPAQAQLLTEGGAGGNVCPSATEWGRWGREQAGRQGVPGPTWVMGRQGPAAPTDAWCPREGSPAGHGGAGGWVSSVTPHPPGQGAAPGQVAGPPHQGGKLPGSRGGCPVPPASGGSGGGGEGLGQSEGG